MSRQQRRTRRRQSPPARCQHCHRRIEWFGAPSGTGPRRPFDAETVDPRDESVLSGAYPVVGVRAWDSNELLAEVQVMHGYDIAEAKEDVMARPWHRLHRCGERVAAVRAEKESGTQ